MAVSAFNRGASTRSTWMLKGHALSPIEVRVFALNCIDYRTNFGMRGRAW